MVNFPRVQHDLFNPDHIYELLEGSPMEMAGDAILPSIAELVHMLDTIACGIYMLELQSGLEPNHLVVKELEELQILAVKCVELYEEEIHHMTNTLFCWHDDLRRRPV
jgi:hypothetical protein